MQTTHTPGPWYLNIDTVHIRKGVDIQPVTHHMAAQGMADARLIATAPELLAVCKAALLRDDVADSDLGDMLRLVIAKATGVK